jgi:mannose-6-phosphate isomerase-like protein (cupin superfamily)
MNPQHARVIRLDEKLKTITGRSEYLFHFSSYSAQEDICYFEGFYKDAGPKAALHFHKTITEIFTVQEGEFTFHLPGSSAVLGPGDTIVARPLQVHGFTTNRPDSRMQIISTGFKNRENFFIELSRMANGEIKLDEQEMEAFFNRYDQYTYK